MITPSSLLLATGWTSNNKTLTGKKMKWNLSVPLWWRSSSSGLCWNLMRTLGERSSHQWKGSVTLALFSPVTTSLKSALQLSGKTPTGCVWNRECSEKRESFTSAIPGPRQTAGWRDLHIIIRKIFFTQTCFAHLSSLCSFVKGSICSSPTFLSPRWRGWDFLCTFPDRKKRDGGVVLAEWQQCHPLVGFDI